MSKNEMSRGKQTAIICAVMAVVGIFVAVALQPEDPYDRFAECKTLFGYDSACKAEVAAKRLRGSYYP